MAKLKFNQITKSIRTFLFDLGEVEDILLNQPPHAGPSISEDPLDIRKHKHENKNKSHEKNSRRI